MDTIKRKSLLYKSNVEYGDFTINHVLGCSHGCQYPCYAFMMARRFGRVKNYEEWIKPKLVENCIDLLNKEIPKFYTKIESVQLCFTTDPFMMGYPEVMKMSLKIIKLLNDNGINCRILTKGILPTELGELSKKNEYGISIVSLNNEYRIKYEPFSADYNSRIKSLRYLHNLGFKTWVSIEPYPTPNIVKQDINSILHKIGFTDKIIFGRLNYNSLVSKYKDYQEFYNNTAQKVITYCEKNKKEYHIKSKTVK